MPSATGDIFGYKRSRKPLGVFSTEDSTLIFGDAGDGESGGTNAKTYLVQNWQVQYNQTVQELFEIGSNELYWVKGRPTGQGNLTRLLGTDTSRQAFFPSDAFDICNGGVLMRLAAQSGHCPATGSGADAVQSLNTGVEILMDGCVVTSVGFSMQVADVRLVESFVWRFAYLKLDDYTGAPAAA